MLESGAGSQKEGARGGGGRGGGFTGGLAKEKHWFGLGRTPCPIQAENIGLIWLLRQKEEEQVAQAPVPMMLSADRENVGWGLKARAGQQT